MKFVIKMIFKPLMLVAVAAFLSACPPEPCKELNAGFSASVNRGSAPLQVAFNDESTGRIKNWEWDFGDGNKSQTQNPIHQYAISGTYAVSLTVICEDGATDSETKNGFVEVSPEPNADFSADVTSGIAPLTVRFTDLSTGEISSWEWDFGDSTKSQLRNPVHQYNKGNLYTVRLTINGGETEVKRDYIKVDEVRLIEDIANIGPRWPKQIKGDCDFFGNGPYVKVTAALQRQLGDRTVSLRLNMRAEETGEQGEKWSVAEGQWEEILPMNLPTNWVIKDIVSNPNAQWDYTDTNIDYDTQPNPSDLGRFRVLGDTRGSDICAQTLDDSHMYFEDIRFQLRVGPR